jgi:hypothetical protein
MSRLIKSTNTVVTLGSLPPDLQSGDVMFRSRPSGIRRGMPSFRRRLVESLLVLLLGGIAGWPFVELAVRAGLRWAILGMLAAVAWGAFMGYLIGRDIR